MESELSLPKIRGKKLQSTGDIPLASACSSSTGRNQNSPMVSYLQLRATAYKGKPQLLKYHKRHHSVEGKEPLVSIAGKTPETGCAGGFFNSSTVIKSLPLEQSPVLQGISPHKSGRTFVIRGDRYLPHVRSLSDTQLSRGNPRAELRSAIQDTVLCRGSPQRVSQQRTRLLSGEWRRNQTQLVKNFLQDPPHRLDYDYYMRGSVCPLRNKETPPLTDREGPGLPNTELYFGRGIRMSHQQSLAQPDLLSYPQSNKDDPAEQADSDPVFITEK